MTSRVRASPAVLWFSFVCACACAPHDDELRVEPRAELAPDVREPASRLRLVRLPAGVLELATSDWRGDPSGASSRGSLAALPAGVELPARGLGLFADYRASEDGRAPLYLINASARDLALPSGDGQPHVYRYALTTGGWRRVEPPRHGGCLLRKVIVPAGQYARVGGEAPGEGVPMLVRYQAYERPGEPVAVSNVGVGFVDLEAMARARHDALAERGL